MARNDAFVLSLAPHLLPKKPQFLAFRHASCLHRRIRPLAAQRSPSPAMSVTVRGADEYNFKLNCN
jgi:hypothetical protein